MKKITLILSILASIVALSGCSSWGSHAATETAAPSHHDFKGESK